MTYSNSFAWRIPRTEEPGRLHSPWGRRELDMTEQLTLTPLSEGLETMGVHQVAKEQGQELWEGHSRQPVRHKQRQRGLIAFSSR